VRHVALTGLPTTVTILASSFATAATLEGILIDLPGIRSRSIV
jgi:hypothetical protein